MALERKKSKRKKIESSWKYRKAKYAYQYAKKHNKEIKLNDIETKYKLSPGTIYVWKSRYNWDDLTDFIDLDYPVTIFSQERLEKAKEKGNKVTKEFIEEFQKLAQYKSKETGKMLTQEEISDRLGISRSYLYKLRNTNVDIALIWERREGIAKVEEALFAAAIGAKSKEVIKKEGKNDKGNFYQTETKERELAPDTKAAIHILNKQGEKSWNREKEDTNANIDDTVKLPSGLRAILEGSGDS